MHKTVCASLLLPDFSHMLGAPHALTGDCNRRSVVLQDIGQVAAVAADDGAAASRNRGHAAPAGPPQHCDHVSALKASITQPPALQHSILGCENLLASDSKTRALLWQAVLACVAAWATKLMLVCVQCCSSLVAVA